VDEVLKAVKALKKPATAAAWTTKFVIWLGYDVLMNIEELSNLPYKLKTLDLSRLASLAAFSLVILDPQPISALWNLSP
jgi:hypothetical protein